jgi:hypothetical protein
VGWGVVLSGARMWNKNPGQGRCGLLKGQPCRFGGEGTQDTASTENGLKRAVRWFRYADMDGRLAPVEQRSESKPSGLVAPKPLLNRRSLAIPTFQTGPQ